MKNNIMWGCKKPKKLDYCTIGRQGINPKLVNTKNFSLTPSKYHSHIGCNESPLLPLAAKDDSNNSETT